MSKWLHQIVRAVLVPAPFLVAAWTVVAWLIFHRSLGGFLSLVILVPVAFVQLALAGLVLWLRPSFRREQLVALADALWYFGTFALWLVAVTIPGAWGGAAQLIAAVFAGFAINQLWRRRGSGSAGTRAERIIVVETNETWDARPSSAARHIIDAEIIEDAGRGRGDAPDEWTAYPRSR